MVNSISGLKYDESFKPFNPLFNKVISISYSLFDDFPKPESTTVFNYKYIGLRRKKEAVVSDDVLGENLRDSLKKIIEKDREDEWFTCIGKIINLENLGLNTNDDLSITWIESLVYEKAKRLSSGQSSMLFILTELIAEIERESLILFDEPETHLHPTGIAQLIKSLYKVLETNKSFAIISTHSPIIIQDIPSKYITVFDRQGNYPLITKLPIESFGESLSNLSKEVFQTLTTPELYKRFLKKLVHSNQSKIDELFPEGLSLNALLYLESLKEKF
jgi:predicted ATPase